MRRGVRQSLMDAAESAAPCLSPPPCSPPPTGLDAPSGRLGQQDVQPWGCRWSSLVLGRRRIHYPYVRRPDRGSDPGYDALGVPRRSRSPASRGTCIPTTCTTTKQPATAKDAARSGKYASPSPGSWPPNSRTSRADHVAGCSRCRFQQAEDGRKSRPEGSRRAGQLPTRARMVRPPPRLRASTTPLQRARRDEGTRGRWASRRITVLVRDARPCSSAGGELARDDL